VDHMSGHPQHHPAQPGEHADPPGPHGMAVIGEQAIYCSHLPMFMVPHDYQCLLEVGLEGDGDPGRRYFDDRAEHPEQRLYTFNPVPFVLPDIFPGEDGPARSDSFEGSLHRGHFERSSTRPVELADGVTARVRNVIYSHKFEPDAEELPELRYLLFGTASEMFLAHVITRPPDFDHLLSVGADQQFSDEDLRNGIVVTISDRPNTPAARIKPEVDTKLPAVIEAEGGSQPVELRPQVEFYFEQRELAEGM
jgi:hypothetical protein